MVNTQAIESRRELNAIYEVSKTLATSLDVAKTFREALNYLLHAFDWRRAFVVLSEPEGRLNGLCAVGLTREEHQRLQFQSNEGIVGRVFTNGIQVVVPDVQAEPLFLNRTGGLDQTPGVTVAMLVTPIRADRHTIGVLAVDCLNPDEKRGFSNDLQLLKMVSTLMGQALLLHRSVSSAHDNLQDEVRRMQKGLLKPGKQLPQVVGGSTPMQEVFAQVHKVAPTRTTVLLRGESGTGKEVIARALHNLSTRKNDVFVSVNCAALSESLLESELFGHEKGAFTDARQAKRGLLEVAGQGTVFLDEVAELSLEVQPKLLKVIEERSFRRLGGTATLRSTARVVVATHQPLTEAVAERRFRADLYYRLQVLTLTLPPLRARPDEILPLAYATLPRGVVLSADAEQALLAYRWPGNIRELKNTLWRAVILADGRTILPGHLGLSGEPRSELSNELSGERIGDRGAAAATAPKSPNAAITQVADHPAAPLASPTGGSVLTLDAAEKRAIATALAAVNGNRTRAARLLGIARSTLLEKLKRFEQLA
jgi:Nif-specific regulatory protein